MNLQTYLDTAQAGGPGSGCKGPNCGRKATGRSVTYGRRERIKRLDDMHLQYKEDSSRTTISSWVREFPKMDLLVSSMIREAESWPKVGDVKPEWWPKGQAYHGGEKIAAERQHAIQMNLRNAKKDLYEAEIAHKSGKDTAATISIERAVGNLHTIVRIANEYILNNRVLIRGFRE